MQKVLVGLDEEKQELILNSIIGQKLSVRQTEDLVRDFKINANFENKNMVSRKPKRSSLKMN